MVQSVMAYPEGRAGAGGLYGTLEVLILRTLSAGGPLHGLDVARRIHELSQDVLDVEEGALYPALHRLQRQGLIEGEWRISDKRRRARFYDITDTGRGALRDEIANWIRHTDAVSKVLGLSEAKAP
ncbi:MAG: PadR family transcriptional regulator [Gemmatimonadetes bacterium]|nr:PadR family transcriptional regulator [Gemmatimonadota bacterium]